MSESSARAVRSNASIFHQENNCHQQNRARSGPSRGCSQRSGTWGCWVAGRRWSCSAWRVRRIPTWLSENPSVGALEQCMSQVLEESSGRSGSGSRMDKGSRRDHRAWTQLYGLAKQSRCQRRGTAQCRNSCLRTQRYCTSQSARAGRLQRL